MSTYITSAAIVITIAVFLAGVQFEKFQCRSDALKTAIEHRQSQSNDLLKNRETEIIERRKVDKAIAKVDKSSLKSCQIPDEIWSEL